MSLHEDYNKLIVNLVKSHDLLGLAELMINNTTFFNESAQEQKQALIQLIPLIQNNNLSSLCACGIHCVINQNVDYNTISEILHSATSEHLFEKSEYHSIFRLVLKGLIDGMQSKSLTESNVLMTLTPILLFLSNDIQPLHLTSTEVLVSAWKNYPSLIPQIVQDICIALSTSTAPRSKSIVNCECVPLDAALIIALQCNGDLKQTTILGTQFIRSFFGTLQSTASPSLLNTFTLDLISLSSTVEFPSALLILQLLINVLLNQLVHNNFNSAIRNIGIDVLSQICCFFTQPTVSFIDSKKMQEVCNSCGCDFVQTEAVQWSSVPQGMCGKCYVKDLINDFWKRLAGRQIDETWFIREVILARASITTPEAYKVLCGIFERMIDPEDEKNKQIIETQIGWEEPASHFIIGGVSIPESINKFIPFDRYSYLSIVIPEFKTILEMCINCLLKMTTDSQALVRSRSLKGILSLIKLSEDLSKRNVVQKIIISRLRDKAASVRESALDLIAVQLETKEVNEVVDRLFDISVSVRKKAVKIVLHHIKEMISTPESHAIDLLKRIFLIASRPDRQNDREEAKRILREVFIPLDSKKISLLIDVTETEYLEAISQLLDNFNAIQMQQLQEYLLNQLASDKFNKIILVLKATAKDNTTKSRICSKLSLLLSYISQEDIIQTNNVLELMVIIIPTLTVNKADEIVLKKISTTTMSLTFTATNPSMISLSVKCFIETELKKNEIERVGEFCVQFMNLSQNVQVRQRALSVLAVLFRSIDISNTNALKQLFPAGDKPIPVELFNKLLLVKSQTNVALICQMNAIFGLLQQYPGLYIQYESIKNYFTVYISKTLQTNHEQLCGSTLSLLNDLFEAISTDELSVLQMTLAQQHTKELISLLKSINALIRYRALTLASSIIKKGLINPIELISSLIALVTDKTQLTSSNSISLLRLIGEKHSSLILCRFSEGVTEGYQLRGNEHLLSRIPHPLSSIYTMFTLTQRKNVITTLTKRYIDALENMITIKEIYQQLFVLETLVLLQYTKSTELILIIQPLKRINGTVLPDIRDIIKKRQKDGKNISPDLIAQLVACVFTTVCTKFLIDYYNFNEESSNDPLNAQIADLQDENNPFIIAGFKYLDKVFTDAQTFGEYWKYSKKIMDGEYCAFLPSKK
ncbi:HEAT repeat domain containing protein [Entamoeba histolytica HM-1:IMSS-B]|uniref:Sister chromatid cohesion protein n=6 Tax=Entamoeba histolytica TaxID=5759 RepID=C4M6Q8_ENTH1|nr:HEAT repeat domain containing protein [Entamoeba histolytica HM-1:IMSS]EMD49143.1 HEAT repeat domain containing protein [Entamoeba histolytica KU27]EMH75866.1 HEAT repeat domain containing protein [Entamoeba histolytica HM-1:IMSS-B]EMS17301.1 HEAT repeat domain containing protein [Entamoeba histolytica HM-3:IMSS]ENY63312.1 HEAT repeat domain containing protein [Entamoeba histolytica HM-1:IMSS-A]GAT97180.1 heat repeat domain containing protein [Entamoeba histolytica]|eukprot:XP_651999.2 HEAT repeat domain containing protein [Entamoeba histolytica HM-1:IMSS]